MQSYSLPSDTREYLTLSASGSTYTAPANGWFAFASTSSSSSGYVQLTSSVGINTRCLAYASNTRCACYLPCRKGDVVTINYLNESSFYFIFIYAVGSEPQT